MLLFDNDSTDNLQHVIQPLVSEGIVEYHRTQGDFVQLKSYNTALARATQNAVDWLVVVDVDEYLTLLGKHEHCVHDFLGVYEGEDIGGVALNRCYTQHRCKYALIAV